MCQTNENFENIEKNSEEPYIDPLILKSIHDNDDDQLSPTRVQPPDATYYRQDDPTFFNDQGKLVTPVEKWEEDKGDWEQRSDHSETKLKRLNTNSQMEDRWQDGYCSRPPLTDYETLEEKPIEIEYCIDAYLGNWKDMSGRLLSGEYTKQGINKPVIPNLIREPNIDIGEKPDAPLFNYTDFDWSYTDYWEHWPPKTFTGIKHEKNICLCTLPGYRDILLNHNGTTTLEQAMDVPQFIYTFADEINKDKDDFDKYYFLERSILRWGSQFLPTIIQETPQNYELLIDTTSFDTALSRVDYLHSIGVPSDKIDQTLIYYNKFLPTLLEYVPDGLVTVACDYDAKDDEIFSVRDTLTNIDNITPALYDDIIFRYGKNQINNLFSEKSLFYNDMINPMTTLEDTTSLIDYLDQHNLCPEIIDDIFLHYGERFLPEALDYNLGLSLELIDPDLTLERASVIMNYIASCPIDPLTVDKILLRYASRFSDYLWAYKPYIKEPLEKATTLEQGLNTYYYLKLHEVPIDVIDTILLKYGQHLMPELLSYNITGLADVLKNNESSLDELTSNIEKIRLETIEPELVDDILLTYGHENYLNIFGIANNISEIYNHFNNSETDFEIITADIKKIQEYKVNDHLIDEIVFEYANSFLPSILTLTNGVYSRLISENSRLEDATSIVDYIVSKNIPSYQIDDIILEYGVKYLPNIFEIKSEISETLQNENSTLEELEYVINKLKTANLSDDLIDDIVLTYGKVHLPHVLEYTDGIYKSLKTSSTKVDEMQYALDKLTQFEVHPDMIDKIIFKYARSHLPVLLEFTSNVYNSLNDVNKEDHVIRSLTDAYNDGLSSDVIDVILSKYGSIHFPRIFEKIGIISNFYNKLSDDKLTVTTINSIISIMKSHNTPFDKIDDVLIYYTGELYLSVYSRVGTDGLYGQLIKELEIDELKTILNKLKTNNAHIKVFDNLIYNHINLHEHILDISEELAWTISILSNPESELDDISALISLLKSKRIEAKVIDILLIKLAQSFMPDILLQNGYLTFLVRSPLESNKELVKEVILESNIDADMFDQILLKYSKASYDDVLDVTVDLGGIYDVLKDVNSTEEELQYCVEQMDMSLIDSTTIDHTLIKHATNHLPFILSYHDGISYGLKNATLQYHVLLQYYQIWVPTYITIDDFKEILIEFDINGSCTNDIIHKLGLPYSNYAVSVNDENYINIWTEIIQALFDDGFSDSVANYILGRRIHYSYISKIEKIFEEIYK